MVSSEDYLELERRCRTLERQLEIKNEELKQAEQERRLLGDLATVNSLTVRKFELDRDYNRSVLPEDSLDKICRLENSLKFEKLKAEQAAKELKAQALTISKQEKEIERLNAVVEEIKRETGWTKTYNTRTATRSAPQPEAVNRIGELQLMNARLEEEQQTNKQIQRKKTLLIESLSKELDQKRKLEEELYQSQNNLKLKDKEIKELTEELKILKRIQAKKDKVICGLETSKDDTAIRILEGDKRFLQAEISKQQEIRRQQEKTIKSQQFRIEQLEARMDAVGVALKDLNLDKQLGDVLRGPLPPKADVASMEPVYDLQLRHVESLRAALTVKEALLAEKDSNVEALERKVSALSASKGSSTAAAERRYRAELDDLKKSLDAQTNSLKAQIDRLRAENARLKGSASVGSTP